MTDFIQLYIKIFVLFAISLLLSKNALANTPVEKLSLVQGNSEVVSLKNDIGTLLVGDESVADVFMLSADSFYIFAKKSGTTNLQVLNENGKLLSVINVSVGADLDSLSDILSNALPGADLRPEHSPGGIVLLGWVDSESDRERALNIASGYASAVVDALKVRNQKQIYVQVRFIEISSRKTRELGGEASLLGALQASKARGFAPTISIGANIDSQITALLARGEARYLAAPTLTALVGTTSSFLAGGEIPIVSTGSDGQTKTEFKEYGVRLSFTPEINDNGAISLTMEPEVSQVDETRSTASLVALTTRRAKTTTEVQSGETIMLAGLLQYSSSRGINAIPGLGEMPVIGPLFRKSNAGDSKTELIILVKPMLSKPDRSAMKLKQNVTDSELTDGEQFFIDGKIRRSSFSVQDVVNGIGITGEYGHILRDHKREISGE